MNQLQKHFSVTDTADKKFLVRNMAILPLKMLSMTTNPSPLDWRATETGVWTTVNR